MSTVPLKRPVMTGVSVLNHIARINQAYRELHPGGVILPVCRIRKLEELRLNIHQAGLLLDLAVRCFRGRPRLTYQGRDYLTQATYYNNRTLQPLADFFQG
jgi:hypothetical protein